MNGRPAKGDLTRRDFFKVSAVAAALIGMGDQLFVKSAGNVLKESAYSLSSPEGEWKASFCSGCHQPTCATKVKVVDGIAVEVKGDLNSPTNKGTLCPRGNSILFNLYNPYRVKAPLKRTNPNKGLEEDPGWMEISWEEALATTSEKLKEIRETDPRSFLYMKGFGTEENPFPSAIPFPQAFGTPNFICTAGPLCPIHFGPLSVSGTTTDRVDVEHCNYVVVVGGNLGGNVVISSGSTANFMNAVDRGMQVVSVDPRCTSEAKSGEWVPIRPGTETALGLGLVYSIIHEIGKYDETWLKIRSNAPYLLKVTDEQIKGTRVFMQDYLREPESNKPLVWDMAANKAVPFDHARGDTYALTGNFEIDGVDYQPAFQVLSDYVKQFTPDWAGEVTGVAPEKIREIATKLVENAMIGATIEIDGFTFPHRPACVFIRRGAVSHKLGNQAYRALEIVNMLLGCIDVPGGILANTVAYFHPLLKPDEDGVQVPSYEMPWQIVGVPFTFPPNKIDMSDIYPEQHAVVHLAWKAINNPDQYYIKYPVSALMITGANPITSNANRDEPIEAFKQIPFIVSIAYHYDEPTQFADIVLPEDSPLEATNMFRLFRVQVEATDENRGMFGTLIKKGVTSRLYDTRHVCDIQMEIAKRVGFLPKLNEMINKGVLRGDKAGLAEEQMLEPETLYTWDEIVERKIKSDFGSDSGFNDFKETALKVMRLPLKETYNYYYMPENKVRLPIYWARMPKIITGLLDGLHDVGATVPNQDEEDLSRHYSALPIWYEAISQGQNLDYPLYAVGWKTHFINQNTHDRVENPWLQEILDKYVPDMKVILVSKTTAAKLGFSEGDEIWVESQFGGKTSGKVHLTNLIYPECIGIGGNFGRMGIGMNPKAKEGPQYNQLLSADEGTFDPIAGSLEISPRVKVYKA